MEITPFMIGVIIVGIILAGIIYSIGKKILALIVLVIAVLVLVFDVSFQDAFHFTTGSITKVIDQIAPTIESELQSGKYEKMEDGTESITSSHFSIIKTKDNDYQITLLSLNKTFSLKEFLEMIPKNFRENVQETILQLFSEHQLENPK